MDPKRRGQVSTVSYDTLSRRTAMDEPNMGLWTFGYDANGNLVSQTDARGIALSFQYDALNRITSKKDAGGAGPAYVIYTYDEPGFANSAGRLTTVLDGSGTVGKTTFEYDKMGRPTRTVKTVDDPAHPFATETAYDDLGRAISVTYPGGDVVTYDYDGVVLKKVNSLVPLTGDGKTAYAEFSGFNAMGQVGAVIYANNVVTTYAYDTRNNRLSSIRSVSPAIDPVKPFQSLTFSYDNAGNVTSVADGVAPGYSMTYQYDELNRLTLADRGLDPPQVYSYDPTGNILGGPAGDYTYGARPYAVTSVVGTGGTKSYGYDNNGNMTSRPGKEVEYDFANRVSSIQLDSGNITFTYDHQGRRVKKATTQPSHETIYIGKTFERTDGAETFHIFAGSMRIASKTPSGIFFYHTDHLGGTNFVTDMAGLKKEAIRYEPYGTLRHDNGTVKLPYKFTGQELDDESGLYYYIARYYDPEIGRFVSADPILHAYYDPATFDRLPGHSYLPADPPLNKDKTGHFALKNPAVLKTMDSLPGRVNSPDLGGFSDEKIWNKGKELAAVVDVVWVPENTLNAYAYVSNNPVNVTDPLGLTDCGASDYGGHDGGDGVGGNGSSQGTGPESSLEGKGISMSKDTSRSTGPTGIAGPGVCQDRKGINGILDGLEFGAKALVPVTKEVAKTVATDVAQSLTNYAPVPPSVGFWGGRVATGYNASNSFSNVGQEVQDLSSRIEAIHDQVFDSDRCLRR